MTEPLPFEQQAESLKLREKPLPTTRINRNVVIILACVSVVLLFGIVAVALQPPTLNDGEAKELYVTTNQPKADQLTALPASYDKIEPEPVILGDPLPGDLGATILETERQLGIEPTGPQYVTDFKPSQESEAARAERLRLAKLERESLSAGLFFDIRGNGRVGAASTNNGIPQSAPNALSNAPFSAFNNLPASSAVGTSGLQQGRDPNFQDSKIAFANAERDEDIYNPHDLQDAISPYQVMTGTIIAASLVTGLNSDLPDTVIAQVTQPVYDTASGRHLLIPQGSRLIGRYDSQVSFGQSRALVVWDRIIFPDSSSIQIPALPGTDQAGFSGLRDRVNNHYGRLLGAVGLATLLGVGTELTFGDDESDLVEAIRDSAQDATNQAGQRIVDRNLNIQPTIEVRPGWPLRVIVTRDLILRPFSNPTLK